MLFDDDFVKNFIKPSSEEKISSESISSEIHREDQSMYGKQFIDQNKLEKQFSLVKIFFVTWFHFCAMIGLYCCFDGAKTGTVLWGNIKNYSLVIIQLINLHKIQTFSFQFVFSPR